MSKSWSLRADLFRTSFSLVGCDLLQSRGRARRFLSWQEQPSPNSKNDIRGLRLEKRMLGAGSVRLRAFGRLAGLANPLGDYGQGVRLLALTGARRSEVFWPDVADSSLFGRWWSSAFRLTTPIFVAHGPALLFGISRWLSQHGISRKRRNNLTRVLIAVERSTQESKANSSHPSSREGHRCAGLSLRQFGVRRS